ncbi:hypothetical protein EZS27_018725 [termite gut metagenome]|uniref:Glycoside hydrolase family 2 n=1 Tax=termite gut metagenome TaxID=433724 RepID=A0A5J4RID8_9ZZZZ
MKSIRLFFAAFAVMFFGCSTSPNFSAIEQSFITPPDNIRTGVYWYWINGHISKEGVVRDLQAMKKAGINRAFIGSNIVSGSDFGTVKVFSDEWYEILHTAMKTAGELDIEIGMFNCPGWSQSGGPWIKPEQSMRYLASSETRVKGPAKVNQKLATPAENFQDVKVLAFPVTADYGNNLLDAPGVRLNYSQPKILVSQPSEGSATYILPAGETSIDILFPQVTATRGLAIYPTGHFYAEVELQAKEGNEFRTVKQFKADRMNTNINVGFAPNSPLVVSVPETQSQEYRLLFHQTREGSGILKIELTATPLLERYPEKTLAKMFPSPLPPWNYYLWDKQPALENVTVATPQQVQDVSQYMAADGTFTWDVPDGDWIIMRTGMMPTGVKNSPASPEATGLEVDKMSKAHVASHFDGFLGKILERIPAKDRKTWRVVVEDSYEMGSQNFTDSFLQDFQQRYGYDAVPFLPVLQGHIIGSPDLSDRFLWDVRRMVADKVSYDYVGGLRDISHRNGMTTWLENYGHWGFPGEFLQYGGQSDEIGGEFWSGNNLGSVECRLASSCAHIYGKRKVWAESFTSGGPAFTLYPTQMKRGGDWSFTEGINNTLLHVYIEQPYEDRYPGVDAWFGNEFNRKNTWFEQMDLFTTYLKRCNFMMQQGLDVADAAYFIGEDVPKMAGMRDPALPKGYSFDYINAEVIIRDLSVKAGRLVLPHGTSYRILVLPPLETMRFEVLQKLEQLIAAGAVVLGPPPSRSPSMQGYPEADLQVETLAAKMWGDLSVKQRTYGKGTILTDMTMEEAFALLNVIPDFRTDNDAVLYSHRTLDGNAIYFLSNQSEQAIQFNATFRVNGLKPELWDATTGIIRPLPAFEQTGETTTVPLQLDNTGSALIVFREKGISATKDISANYPAPQVIANVDTPWTVRFESDSAKRGPAEAVTFATLTDWSNSEDEHIKYYSGTAVYSTHINLDSIPAGKRVYIDLGKVVVSAKVTVNGKYAGGAWTAPYRVEISKQLQQGDNTLEIEVVNTWRNRLIGDSRLPAEERIVQANSSRWQAENPLQSAGLLGPVQIAVFD